MVGTKTYVPPEIFLNIPYDGVKFDVFSLGVVLFTMYSGYPPFASS